MSLLTQYLPTSVATYSFASSTLAKVASKLASGRLSDHLLLYGDPGTGKSTICEMILRERYANAGVSINIEDHRYEGAAWSSKSFDSVLGQINIDLIRGVPTSLTIINEVDQLSSANLADLKAFTDKWQQHKFLLSTNHLHKLPPNMQSRCQTFKVELPPASSIVPLLQSICNQKGYALTAHDADEIVANSCGDWRRLERNLESVLP